MEQLPRFASSVDTILKHLQNTQCWPADIMRRHQFELLRPLVAHAYRTVAWYRRRFDELRVAPERITDDVVWRSVPLLTRADIQAAGESLHSSAVPPIHGRITKKWTSGSTATPLMVLRTEVTARFWNANTIREYAWRACDLSGKLAVIRSLPRKEAEPPLGASFNTWGTATAGRIKTGPCVVLDVRSTTAEQAEWLVREKPAYLQTYPSVALELAKNFLEAGRQLPDLRQVHTFGEVLDPKARDACRQAWDAEVFDSYSTNEVGYVAAECARHGGYHVEAEHLLVEVLDDHGGECGCGDTGRVVVTDLFNYAMPLLRYEIGDYAEVGEPCKCGRKLPTLRRILGRQRNMFVLPNGEKRFPALGVDAVGSFEGRFPVRQFQVIQRSRTELEVKLVVARFLTPQEEGAIRGLMAKWFSGGFFVRLTYVDQIPRGPTGKFEDFRCDMVQDS
jgi:phenylacetate-CoA ligase